MGINKFGFDPKKDIPWKIIIKLVIFLVVIGVVIGVVKIFGSDLSKYLGWIPNVVGGAGNSFAKCFDCNGQMDANGKIMDPKVACPPGGNPFFNEDCGAFFGTIAMSLLAFLALVMVIAKYKGGRTKMSEAAKTQGNVADDVQRKVARESIDSIDKSMESGGDAITESFKDSLEYSDFKAKWNSDNPGDKVPDYTNRDDFNKWVESKGTTATELQKQIRDGLDKTVTKTMVSDALKQMKVNNNLHDISVKGGSTSEQRTAMDTARTDAAREQGDALAREAGIDADAAREVSDDATREPSGESSDWEDALHGLD
jgi:hypothetical protein